MPPNTNKTSVNFLNLKKLRKGFPGNYLANGNIFGISPET